MFPESHSDWLLVIVFRGGKGRTQCGITKGHMGKQSLKVQLVNNMREEGNTFMQEGL